MKLQEFELSAIVMKHSSSISDKHQELFTKYQEDMIELFYSENSATSQVVQVFSVSNGVDPVLMSKISILNYIRAESKINIWNSIEEKILIVAENYETIKDISDNLLSDFSFPIYEVKLDFGVSNSPQQYWGDLTETQQNSITRWTYPS